MNSMLNLFPKKYQPNFAFQGLFLCLIPQTVFDHLLALAIQDPDALAKKADAISRASRPVQSTSFLKIQLPCLRNSNTHVKDLPLQ